MIEINTVIKSTFSRNTFNFLESEQSFLSKHALDEKLADTKKQTFSAEKIIIRLDILLYLPMLW